MEKNGDSIRYRHTVGIWQRGGCRLGTYIRQGSFPAGSFCKYFHQKAGLSAVLLANIINTTTPY